ncbi:hypothetical protein Taro_041725 [Colocasia esculenta]|uniref:Transcription factor CBF/NF-Y/archaeal histone domain-containing protein n=1 Tax=Colocasia esculenta TaxID=4460 RepID=A0A843WGK9_COLES|nr:hypothetical protein [Colocasia esculenta]
MILLSAETEDNPNGNSNNGDGVPPAAREARSDHDRLVPIASVVRIMRKALPSHALITDEAKEAVQRFLYDFMVRLTAVANESCHQEQRKTVTAEDLLRALGKLGLREYVDYLSLYLNRYRLHEGEHRHARRDHLLSQVVGTAGATFSAWPFPAPPGAEMGAPVVSYSARFFPDEGGSSSGAAAAIPGATDGAAAMMMLEQEGNAAASPAGPPQWPPQPFGFDPFARHN